MVKKLFKHEILAYSRVMPIVYLVLITVALASRVIQIFESDTNAYSIISSFSFITYGISIFAAIIFNFIFVIVRYYKNMFSGEGYLTFTLPVTPAQHIAVKFITALLSEACLIVAIIASLCVITAGDVLVEVVKASGYLTKIAFDGIGINLILFSGEIIVLLLITSAFNILLSYTCISIGQLFKKNRILAAIGVYFVYYIITQIISTVITVVFSVFSTSSAMLKTLEIIVKHPIEAIHIFLLSLIVLFAGFATVLFFVVKRIIAKRLNLE